MDSGYAALSLFARYEFLFILGSLFILVLYQMANGQINLNGLLSGKGWSSDISPGRIQLLIATLIGAFYYASQVAAAISQGTGHLISFPSVPRELLGLLGASHLFYLGGKGAPLVANTIRHRDTVSDNSQTDIPS